jgi:hypothetical protein
VMMIYCFVLHAVYSAVILYTYIYYCVLLCINTIKYQFFLDLYKISMAHIFSG